MIRASNTVGLIVSIPLCRHKFELRYCVHTKMSEEICLSSLCSAALCFAMDCLHWNTVDNRNAVDQLLSLTLGLLLWREMWKKIFFLPLLNKTAAAFLAELYLKCWPKANRAWCAVPQLHRNLFCYHGVQDIWHKICLVQWSWQKICSVTMQICLNFWWDSNKLPVPYSWVKW